MKKIKSKDKFFRLCDMLTPAERMSFGIKANEYRGNQIKAKATGEFREPKKGEWYLSGAEIEAYRAHNDINGNKFFIAKLVKTETKTVTTEIEIK